MQGFANFLNENLSENLNKKADKNSGEKSHKSFGEKSGEKANANSSKKQGQKFFCFERIKKSAEIRDLFKSGKKVSTNGAKLFFKKNGLSFSRIAFALPRGYGNAVARNASRRFSREVFRLCKSRLKNGFDILLLVYPGADSFLERQRQFSQLCKKADLFDFEKR